MKTNNLIYTNFNIKNIFKSNFLTIFTQHCDIIVLLLQTTMTIFIYIIYVDYVKTITIARVKFYTCVGGERPESDPKRIRPQLVTG